MKLYMIGGKARSGKDTLGSFIKELYEKDNVKTCMLQLTAPLDELIRTYFNWDGSKNDKPRTLMQELGIDIIKNKLHKEDYLIRILKEKIEILDEFFDVGIITDARLIFEFQELKRIYPDIVTIHLVRENFSNDLTEKQKSHITETNLDNYHEFDYEIKNISLEGLKEEAEKIVKIEREGENL